MDIQSITSSVGAYTSVTPQVSSSKALQQSQQGAQMQAVERREPQASERTETSESTEAALRPVTNTSGQETGKLINVTA
jgi:hypothetical protein